MSKFNIGVVGVGCVGSAVYEYFNGRKDINTVGYDKFKEEFNSKTNFENLLGQDVLFLCLPTLYNDKLKQYNKEAIHNVCGQLNEKRYKGLVVLKSTVEPGTTQKLSDFYEYLDFAHNPEFLTARTAFEDFATQSHIVLGKTRQCKESKFQTLEKLMKHCWPESEFSVCNSTESESMKSFCNCFYAMKISIFNEYYKTCQKLGTSFNKVTEMMLKNGWINNMHTDVPGPDGKLGYGGVCFPKDTSALYQFLRREGLPHRMIKASVKENKEVRY